MNQKVRRPMKTKILLTLLIFSIVTFAVKASDSTGKGSVRDCAGAGQQVIINNYYFNNGYEYASRIKRFHTSYVTFDFYSPLFTETYWYRYTPYTWGVSIYDDWYFYGPGVSRYVWRSGFGGSYWWGYDPWWDYDPWLGYGWSSWYSPGVSFNVNYWLGRPYYHYPVAGNRWHDYHRWNYSRPVYNITNNNYNYYYGSMIRNSHSSRTAYNPSHPAQAARRTGYTVTDGRSSAQRKVPVVEKAPTGQNAQSGENADTPRSENDRDKSNNGLRMGQYRRGTAVPSEPKPNEPARTNNPNVNDRMNPGGEKANDQGQGTIDKAPARSDQSQRTQGTVRSTTRRESKTETRSEKATESRSQTRTGEIIKSGKETGRRSSSSQARR